MPGSLLGRNKFGFAELSMCCQLPPGQQTSHGERDQTVSGVVQQGAEANHPQCKREREAKR